MELTVWPVMTVTFSLKGIALTQLVGEQKDEIDIK